MDSSRENGDALPTPTGERRAASATSLAVFQWIALIRGEWPVQAEQSPFRVESVTGEERYCLGCVGVRWHDVISGQRSAFGFQQFTVCRCCGRESVK